MKAADLRKSILQYAVEGKLVQQDIHDEPADMFYDKIIKEKENLIKQGKIKKEKPLPTITDDEIPYDIPNNWKWVRLGEIVSVIQGTSYNKSDITSNKKDIRIIRGGNIKNYNINILNDDIYIKQSHLNIEKQIYKNDIIIVASTGSKTILGNASFAYTDYINTQIGAFLRIIRPYNSIFFPYLRIMFMTNYYMDYIKIHSKGIGINNIKNYIINNFPIPLPPLKEQERIVKKVDELMALCDKLEQEEEKLLALDKHFADTLPKSILQYAVEGKLVQQDIHDEPASLLYDKIIKEKETLIKQGKIKKEKPLPPITDDEIPYDIPENWKWVRLGEVCEIKRGNGLTKNDFTNSGIPCIHYGQIHKYYKYSTNTTMTYTSEQIGKKLKTVEYSDIIMAITSENIDDVCKSIAWLGNFSIVTGGHTAIIKHWINPLYLIYLFHSNCFQMQKNKIAKGMKVIEVSSEKLKNIIFPLPPLKEQERIVKKVDELLTYCNKLKEFLIRKN